MNQILADPVEAGRDEGDLPLRGLGAVSPEARLVCPRCEHDLRSEPMAWTEACPLAGRCLECGLEFHWADLLSRRRTLPRWSIEGASGLRDWCRRFGPQWLMALVRPGVVHRRIRLEHPRRPRRLATMLLPLLLVTALVPMVDFGWRSLRAGFGAGAAARAAVQVWSTSRAVQWVPPESTPQTSNVWVASTRFTDGWYQTPWTNPAFSPPSVRPEDLVSFRGTPLMLVRVERVGRAVFVETDGSGRVPVATMAFFTGPVRVPIRGPAPWSDAWLPWIDRVVTYTLPLVLLPLAVAGAFVFLPVVRRRARVCRGHIVRLMLLGLLPAATIGLGIALLAQWRNWPGFLLQGVSGVMGGSGIRGSGGGVDQMMVVNLGVPVVLVFAACLAWTASAAARHLRLQRPLAVAAASTAVGVVAVTTGWFIALA